MKIRCLAVDDEPYALKQLADYVRLTPFLELVGECFNAFEAMEMMALKEIDLIFLDINMPEMSGMEFARALPQGMPVIFTTAYSQYAVESYKVNAIDYLLKPLSYEDFLRSAGKAQKVISMSQEVWTAKPEPDHVFVNSDGRIIRINLPEIDFIESLSEYVKIYLDHRKPVITLLRMKNLENLLPKDQFMRVHRSFIVNLSHITTIERNRIVFYGNIYIPVSDQYKADFRKFVESSFL